MYYLNTESMGQRYNFNAIPTSKAENPYLELDGYRMGWDLSLWVEIMFAQMFFHLAQHEEKQEKREKNIPTVQTLQAADLHLKDAMIASLDMISASHPFACKEMEDCINE